ncbi:fumarylacetoacetate hydrolase family protein [Streptomyces sp. NBC_01431]|uniref:fumarylacetoacetate hydrolase family protein n=1 Tax=Streptomyces sp. NBC_01431 TaxID=2903863 RepID=UPI002E31EBE1|nr:fumarylacetoacetate hydrolase family protein [Streptomyces sp. NBC_01431]
MGQDVSERFVQMAGPPPPRFNLGEPCRSFAPMGPWLGTWDGFTTPDDLDLTSAINGEECSTLGGLSRGTRSSRRVPGVPDARSSVAAGRSRRETPLLRPGPHPISDQSPAWRRALPRPLQPGRRTCIAEYEATQWTRKTCQEP